MDKLNMINTKLRNIQFLIMLIAYHNNVPMKEIIITLVVLIGIDIILGLIVDKLS